MSRRGKKWYHRQKPFVLGAGALLTIVLVIGIAYVAGRQIETAGHRGKTVRGDLNERFAQQSSVFIQGKSYQYKEGLKNFLLMGTADMSTLTEAPGPREQDIVSHQAVFLLLLSVNDLEKTVTALHIDGSTVVESASLDRNHYAPNIGYMPISWVYGLGDSEEQGRELVVEATRKLLQGVPIDAYVALSLNSLPQINDMLGGVAVAASEPELVALLQADPGSGQLITLSGVQAAALMYAGPYTDASQRARGQQMYVNGLLEALASQLSKDPAITRELFDTLAGQVVTNLNRGQLISEFAQMAQYRKVTIEGLEGESYFEPNGVDAFIVDEDALIRRLTGEGGFFLEEP